jgi:hypothetical protein
VGIGFGKGGYGKREKNKGFPRLGAWCRNDGEEKESRTWRWGWLNGWIGARAKGRVFRLQVCESWEDGNLYLEEDLVLLNFSLRFVLARFSCEPRIMVMCTSEQCREGEMVWCGVVVRGEAAQGRGERWMPRATLFSLHGCRAKKRRRGMERLLC